MKLEEKSSPANQQKKGFSLIEVLLVIAILSIIASTFTYAMINQQKKARDARRKGDLQQVKRAMTQGKLDCKNASYYPGAGASVSSTSNFLSTVTLLSHPNFKYLPSPVYGRGGVAAYDPPYTNPEAYRIDISSFGFDPVVCPDPTNLSVPTGNQGTRNYVLRVRLENRNDPDLKRSWEECIKGNTLVAYIQPDQPNPNDADSIDDNFQYFVCND